MALLEFEDMNQAKILVVGCGGGGGNAVNTMIASNLDGVQFCSANTDMQALEANMAAQKIQLGDHLTKGLGAGADPEIGRRSAQESLQIIEEMVKGQDMVFVTAGMGGGTGTGAAPVIAQMARDAGAVTVGVVTKPFFFEGRRRKKQAVAGITELEAAVDTLIVIPNDKLLDVAGHDLSMIEAFQKADAVLLDAVRGISDLIARPGLINVDFADVRSVMKNKGRALMGTGMASGNKRAQEAAMQAISSPLLEDISIQGATGVLINITGNSEMGLFEVNEACALIEEAVDEDANIIFGSVVNPDMGDEIQITVIATGFESEAQHAIPRSGQGMPTQSGPTPRAYEARSQITKDYPPTRSARGTREVVVSGPMHGRATTEDEIPIHEVSEVDRALAELTNDSTPSEVNMQLAQGSGPAMATHGAITVPVERRPSEGLRRELPDMHPQLKTVFVDSDLDSELDVPTFLRRSAD